MEFLSKMDDILSLDDRPKIEVEVPEWNVKVYLRAMTGHDREAWEAHVAPSQEGGRPNIQGMRSKMVASCIVGEDGKRIFNVADEVKLASRSAAVIERLFDKCMELNGLTEEDEKKLVENFSETPSEPSSSDSL